MGSDERARSSIVTLIVFLAMILLAAVLAGVLITTAGELQSQDGTTGEELGVATGVVTGEASPTQLAETIEHVTIDASLNPVTGDGTGIDTPVGPGVAT